MGSDRRAFDDSFAVTGVFLSVRLGFPPSVAASGVLLGLKVSLSVAPVTADGHGAPLLLAATGMDSSVGLGRFTLLIVDTPSETCVGFDPIVDSTFISPSETVISFRETNGF